MNAVVEKKSLTVMDRIKQAEPEFEKALPGHIQVDKFVRTVQTALTMQPDIAQAAQKSREAMQSLMVSCTKAATDGLIIDGREAALVTFNTKVKRDGKDEWEKHVQYMPMVAGIMKMARNSGLISSIAAHVVHENDKFAYVLGDDERIEHAPSFGNRGEPIAVYAIVKMKDGTVQREVMSKDDVLRIGAQGRNAAQYDPKTGKNYGEWWRKTVIRRISKYLPRSSDREEMREAERFYSAAERIDDDYEFEAEPAPVAQPVKKRGAGAAALKNITPTPAPQPEPEPAQVYDGEIMPDYVPEYAAQPEYAMQAGDDI